MHTFFFQNYISQILHLYGAINKRHVGRYPYLKRLGSPHICRFKIQNLQSNRDLSYWKCRGTDPCFQQLCQSETAILIKLPNHSWRYWASREKSFFENSHHIAYFLKHLCVFHMKRYNVYWSCQTITNSSLRISCIRLVLSIKKQACSSWWIFNLCAWTDCAEHCRQSAALFQRKYSRDLLLRMDLDIRILRTNLIFLNRYA